MTPILGITASSITSSFLGGDFESIATVTVTTATQANIEFTSIPSTYTHLQLRGIGRTDRSATGDSMKVQVNGVTSNSYAFHQLGGDGASAFSDNGTSQANMLAQRLAGATANSNVFGAIVIDILDYKNTNKNTTIRSLGGCDNNGDGFVIFGSGLYNATTAITSIKLLPGSGTNFLTNTTFALYGIL